MIFLAFRETGTPGTMRSPSTASVLLDVMLMLVASESWNVTVGSSPVTLTMPPLTETCASPVWLTTTGPAARAVTSAAIDCGDTWVLADSVADAVAADWVALAPAPAAAEPVEPVEPVAAVVPVDVVPPAVVLAAVAASWDWPEPFASVAGADDEEEPDGAAAGWSAGLSAALVCRLVSRLVCRLVGAGRPGRAGRGVLR